MPVRENSLKNFVFSDEPEKEVPATPTHLSVESIVSRKDQPRRYFDSHSLEQLTESIRQYGILEPLLVRPLGEEKYELVAGERRYKAALRVPLTEVPVTIRVLSEREAMTISLIENLQREDLNPVEETEGILQLLSLQLDLPTETVISTLYRMRNESLGTVNQNVLTNPQFQTVEAVFTSLGHLSWESFITTRLPLLSLPDELLESLKRGDIAYTKAMAIAKISDQEQRNKLLNEAIEQNLSLSSIKERLASILSLNKSNSPVTPAKNLDDLHRRLKKAQLWKNPQKWKKAQGLLKKLEALLEEGEAG